MLNAVIARLLVAALSGMPVAVDPPPATGRAAGAPAPEHRLSLDNSGFAPGRGVRLVSRDGRFALAVRLAVQFRYQFDHDPRARPVEQQSLAVQRARLWLSGHTFGEHNKYFLQLGFAPRELDLHDGAIRNSPLIDAYAVFDYLRELTVWVGQYRVPYSREQLIAEVEPLFVDRSLAHFEFSAGRDIGIDVRSTDFLGLGRLRYYAGAYLGEGRNAPPSSDFGLTYVARVDVLPFGLFSDYAASDLERETRFRASVGGAYAFMDNAQHELGGQGGEWADGGQVDYHNATADAILKYAGWYFESSFLWRRGVRRRSGGRTEDDGTLVPLVPARGGLGYYVQTGYLIPKLPLEPVLRWGQVLAARRGTTSLEDENELGGGLNLYIDGQALKLQVDYFRYFAEDITAGRDQLRLQLGVEF